MCSVVRKTDSQWEPAIQHWELSLVLSVDLEGWNGGQRVQKGGTTCIHVANQHSIVMQLYPQSKVNKRRQEISSVWTGHPGRDGQKAHWTMNRAEFMRSQESVEAAAGACIRASTRSKKERRRRGTEDHLLREAEGNPSFPKQSALWESRTLCCLPV